jgi:chemotaxis protein methyltransferase CheR
MRPDDRADAVRGEPGAGAGSDAGLARTYGHGQVLGPGGAYLPLPAAGYSQPADATHRQPVWTGWPTPDITELATRPDDAPEPRDASRLTGRQPRGVSASLGDGDGWQPPRVTPARPPASGDAATLEDVEIALLLEGVYRHYGYDFRDYARSSLQRRLRHLMLSHGLPSISDLTEKILHEPLWFDRLLAAFSINVSAMFRDPPFFAALRERLVPILRTYPFVRIWHAGCSTGEEVYSTAILLHEAGLYDRCRIYATDINEGVLRKAQEGIFPLAAMKAYTANYIQAGGAQAFSEYYTADYDRAIFRPWLRRNMVFAQHNLAMDTSFNEVHVVICRNVMIYFNRALQTRVVDLFSASLVRLGFLGLGNKESLKGTPGEAAYDVFDADARLYRKVRG